MVGRGRPWQRDGRGMRAGGPSQGWPWLRWAETSGMARCGGRRGGGRRERRDGEGGRRRVVGPAVVFSTPWQRGRRVTVGGGH